MFRILIRNARKSLSGQGVRAQLLRGGVGSLAIRGGQALLAFAVATVLARSLGPEGYGLYSFALAVLMFTAIPAQVGVPQLVVRETAKSQAAGNTKEIRGLWGWSTLAVLLFSGGALLTALAIGRWVGETGDSSQVDVLMAGLLLIPLMAFINLGSSCLRGLRKVVLGQLPEGIVRPVFFLFFLGWGVVEAGERLSAERAMGLFVVAAILALVVTLGLLYRHRPKELGEISESIYHSAEWRKAVMPLALISGLHVINSFADLIILGLFRSDGEVGIYRAASQLALLVIFGLQAINQALHPHFARLYVNGDKERLQRLVTTSARAILGLAFAPFIAFLFLGADILEVIFGSEYASGAIALLILASGQLANAAFGSVGALLNMTGHERDTMRGMLVAMGVNIALNFMLVPAYGMHGAAIATALSYLIWNAVLRWFVWKRLSIESAAFRFGSTSALVR